MLYSPEINIRILFLNATLYLYSVAYMLRLDCDELCECTFVACEVYHKVILEKH